VSVISVSAERHDGDAGFVQQVGFAQFLAQQKGGERRGVERRFQPRPEPRDGADVILMGVGQHDAEDVVGVLLDEAGVRQDNLDAGRGLVAEGHAEIDHDPLAGVRRAEAVEIEVHADLVRPAQRQEDELVVRVCGHPAARWGLRRWISSRPRMVRSWSKWSMALVAPSNSEATPPVPITVRGLGHSVLMRATSPSIIAI
jgi:hypothetical protein